MTDSFDGMQPTQQDALRAIRQRLGILYAEHAAITHEIDELQEEQRRLLYGGGEE